MFFIDIENDALGEHVADFLRVVTGVPDIYCGRDIRNAHAAYHIALGNFDRLFGDPQAGREEEDTQTLLDIIAITRADVVTR